STVISSLSILALASAQTTTGQLGDAAAITNNPEGAIYVATLPISKGVRGTVTAQTAPGGAGVAFQITVDGLPTEGGPFSYHLHDAPVPTNGNCSGTLAHLDPYKRGQTPPCDASAPQTCEVGDLSGKHGKINGTSFSASYVDVYASTLQGIGAFFGNRSVVFHLANSTRISCANFTAL
ncbi:Cu,Zn superoxide dismutase-like protein, partial [Patellaria atrata CBS 101060]